MGAAAKECEEAFVKTQIGKTAAVLFETYKGGINEGYTENYTRVTLKSSENLFVVNGITVTSACA